MTTAYYIPDYEEWARQGCPESDCRSDKVYNPIEEQAPNSRFYRLDRDHIDNTLRDIGSLILNITKQARLEDKQLIDLGKMALEMQKVFQTSTRDIAFVGAQGTGKSLCINALQHRPYLAKTSAEGNACTSSAVRFRLKPDATRDSGLFDAIVKFMDDPELRNIIAEHVRRYGYVHFPIVEGDGPSDEDNLAAEAAWKFLQMVHNSTNDREAEAALSALLNPNSVQNGELLEATFDKAHERISETPAGEDLTITFDNVELDELMKRVHTYIGERESTLAVAACAAH
jgi:hypothetical protein